MTITKTNVEIKAVGFVQSHAEQTFFFLQLFLIKKTSKLNSKIKIFKTTF